MAYAIMRIEKRQMSAVSKIYRHHERQKDAYKSNPDIDIERSRYNFHIIEPTGSYRQMILKRIEEVGAKRRKNSVVLDDCLVTATPEWLKGMDLDDFKMFFNHACTFFKMYFGEENIISAVVHLDEKTPHMHLCFVPITRDNRLCAKEVNGGPKDMIKWQDTFHWFMHEEYSDLERGTPKSVSHRKHIPTYMFKNAAELTKHYEELLRAINDIGIIGNAKKKDEAAALLGRFAPEMAKLKTQLTSTEKYISDMERSAKRDSSEIADLRMENKSVKYDLEEANRELYSLYEQQKKLENMISRIPDDVLQRMQNAEKLRRKERYRGEER